MTTSEGCLRVYDLRRPKAKQLCYTFAHDHMALCLAWLPDASAIVTGGADWTVSMWSGEDLSFLGSEMRHLGYVRCVAASYDCKRVASGSSDLCINVFSCAPFKYEEIKLEGHTSWIRWLHFSHDDNRLISGGDDQSIIIWSMVTQNQMQTLRAHSHTVAAGFSLPNNKLFTAGYDENLLLWSQDTGLLGYLKVFVAEAFDLPRGDILSGTMSNQRFAKIELGKGQQAETKLKSGRSPQWYEEFDLDVWNVDERVNVEIYDWDKDEQHRFLGNVFVPLEELVYADDGITDREFDLMDEEGNPSKSLVSLRFTFRQVKCTGELTVKVEKARNLPRMDTFGLADPFAAVTCGKGTRHKTKVKKNNLNPVWNEEFIFNVEESARELKLVLYDWSFTKEEDFIGQIVISTSDIEKTNNRDEWFKLKALNGTDDAKGEIKLTIRFIPEHERDSTAIRFRRNPASWPVGEKSDFNHYAPVGQIMFFNRTLLRGKCKHCNQRRYKHAKNLRCDLGTGNYFHSLAIDKAQNLMACGTGDGRIRVSFVSTGQQVACWTAHAGPVLGLQFADGDERLLSWGCDSKSVNTKDFSNGSYMPTDASSRDKGKRTCVEIWYVGSMMRAIDIYRKKNLGMDIDDEEEQVAEDDDDSDEDISYNLDDDDDDDDTLTPEEKEERKKEREKMLAKTALGRRKGRQNGVMPGARVGYTPIYYPPPVLISGNETRSCLKGRGRIDAMRAGLTWGEDIPMHYYPPENPETDEEDSESDEDTEVRIRKPKPPLATKGELAEKENSAAEKKRIVEEKRRERSKARQDAKDMVLFGKPLPVARTGSNGSASSPPKSGNVSPERTSRSASPEPRKGNTRARKSDGVKPFSPSADTREELTNDTLLHVVQELSPRGNAASPGKSSKKAKSKKTAGSPAAESPKVKKVRSPDKVPVEEGAPHKAKKSPKNSPKSPMAGRE